MEYEEYLSFAFLFATDRKRKALPRPNQLHPTDKTAIAWNAKLNEHWRNNGFKFARPLAQHDLTHDQGLPAQKAFRHHRIQVHLAKHRHHLEGMRSDVITNRLLEMRHFRTFMRDDVYEDFKKQVEEELQQGLLVPVPAPEARPADLLQSCFGLPGPNRKRNKVCARCPQISACSATAELVLEEVLRQTGSSDPITEREKNLTRNRVDLWRKRQRDARETRGPGITALD